MSKARLHHYIPQAIQRNFLNPHGRLHFARRDTTLRIGESNPKNLFAERDLYTVENSDGTSTDQAETIFARMDDVGASFLRQIIDAVRSNKLPRLDDAAWRTWWNIFYFQLKRPPRVVPEGDMAAIRNTWASALRDHSEMSGVVEGSPEFERMVRLATVQARLSQPGVALAGLQERLGLAIYHVGHCCPKELILGDCVTASATLGGRYELRTEVTFWPIAPDVALGPHSDPHNVILFNVNSRQVNLMNLALANRSHLIAGRTQIGISSMARFLLPAPRPPQRR